MKNTIEKLIEQGGANSEMFWKLRKRIIKKEDTIYKTKDEEGKEINDPEEAKEHIAKYFETFYQAREGTPEYEKWTENIQQEVKSIEENMKEKNQIEEITIKEIKKAIKAFKRGKSTGPRQLTK